MGLEIYGERVTGELLVEDQRPDGSVILLECTPYGAPRQPAPAVGGYWPMGGGVAVSSSPSGSWPMLQESGLARTRAGKLHLDTTRMPGGVLRFNVSVLCAKAARVLAEGTRFVELTTDTAAEWGYLGEARPPSSAEPAIIAGPVERESAEPAAGGGNAGPAEDEGAEPAGDDEGAEPAEGAGRAAGKAPAAARKGGRGSRNSGD